MQWHRNNLGQFTDRSRPERRKRTTLICPNCKKQFEIHLWRIKTGKVNCCSISCSNVIRHTGRQKKKWSLIRELREGNPNLYRNIHKKVYKLYGRPDRCEIRKCTRKKYYWANKTGKYLLKRSDWLMSCASCHWKYDYEKYKQTLV